MEPTRARGHATVLVTLLAGILLALAWFAGSADAKGGTAKPPKGVASPFVTRTLSDPPFAGGNPAPIHGFDDTGFIQDATVDGGVCGGRASAANAGGTVTLNNVTMIVPCNTVIQMPANTVKWAAFVNGIDGTTFPKLPVALRGLGVYASHEVHVIGNIVDDNQTRIAGLIFVSQSSVNSASGVIKNIDYSTGAIEVDNGDGTAAVVKINDPKGRFGRPQSADERYSVDDANPTVHAATGYPMCVPRSTDAAGDPLCPQANRPKPDAGGNCRNFNAAQAGAPVPFTLPVSGDLSRPAAGQTYCSQFVMSDAPAPGKPDPHQQAPFEVGDFIAYSGTLIHPSTGPDYISAHTVEANVGIYTQPGTQPAYMAIGEFGVGTADPNATAVNGAAQETQDRMFLEAETTDVASPVDIYMMDVDPNTGTVRNRWVTPYEMTGENQNGNPSGGITTQLTGPQPQRARIRATKAPTGLLSQPTRMIRVVQRSLCNPQAPADQQLLDDCLNNAPTEANGLVAGQYAAPTFEFIFPENVKPGDPVVPFDFWHLPFLRNGEGADNADGVGPLDPTPWGGPVNRDLPPPPPPPAPPVGPGVAPSPAPAPAGGGATAGGGAATGAGGAAAAPAAGAIAPGLVARLALARPAAVSPGIRLTALATTGIRVRVAVPAGATLVRLRILTTQGKQLAQVFQPAKGGTNLKVRLHSKQLRKALRRGRFVLEVTPGIARNRLGKPSRIAFRVR